MIKITQQMVSGLIIGLLLLLPAAKVSAHCEIPCGIFEDTLRIELMREHVVTIEKSMNQIIALSHEGEKNYNQIVRWVVNKEEHAEEIQEIVSQYFLHQRIKITDSANPQAFEKYNTELRLLHQIAVYAMKAKQSTDLQWIEKLNQSIDAFEDSYLNHHHHH